MKIALAGLERRPFDLSGDLRVLQVIDEQRRHLLFAFGQLVHDDRLSLLERPGDPYSLQYWRWSRPAYPPMRGRGS